MREKILVTNSSQEITNLCVEVLKAKGYEPIVCEKDGAGAYEAIARERPFAALLDVFMVGYDALTVKAKCEENGIKDVKFFAMGSFDNDMLTAQILESGFYYYYLKPFDVDMFANSIARLIQNQSKLRLHTERTVAVDIELEVTEILHKVGVPAHIKGYSFLRDAILMTVREPELINAVTKRLYPEIAKKNSTTSSRVERAIRHAIEVAWDRGDVDVLNSYFGYTIHSLRGKPTNSEFIAMISDKMRLKQKRAEA